MKLAEVLYRHRSTSRRLEELHRRFKRELAVDVTDQDGQPEIDVISEINRLLAAKRTLRRQMAATLAGHPELVEVLAKRRVARLHHAILSDVGREMQVYLSGVYGRDSSLASQVQKMRPFRSRPYAGRYDELVAEAEAWKGMTFGNNQPRGRRRLHRNRQGKIRVLWDIPWPLQKKQPVITVERLQMLEGTVLERLEAMERQVAALNWTIDVERRIGRKNSAEAPQKDTP
ncbi:hypothetical protein GCM10008955_24550 [Deinococcus malanensis]|uniref:CHAD domain-containing protein n=1 Tax=Deinococcus malanensis TaxID=1706855 RepID=A0ABQ2EWW9_9DEIO|nr:hypothetical protein [Deinococcus malanensis]GGK29803.1 hypothetical protein GCM10008955_24550 [Deinococcus malanensis]